jgi:hypothetical protein
MDACRQLPDEETPFKLKPRVPARLPAHIVHARRRPARIRATTTSAPVPNGWLRRLGECCSYVKAGLLFSVW